MASATNHETEKLAFLAFRAAKAVDQIGKAKRWPAEISFPVGRFLLAA